MASREDVYCKFGQVAETAQLLETELGTVSLAFVGFMLGWRSKPNPEHTKQIADELDSMTLGQILKPLRKAFTFEGGLDEKLEAGVKARNRLCHGFYERHNFKIETDEGRDEMIADLEAIDAKISMAYACASGMSSSLMALIERFKQHAETPEV